MTASESRIKVLVVDDQALIRQAIRDILSSTDYIDVCGEAINGIQAVALCEQTHPDVVVMDIRMPEMDGIEATAAICANPRNTDVKILILTTFEEDDYVVSALRAGASGFIGKGAEPEEICEAVATVHSGNALLSPAATRALIGRFTTPQTGSQTSTLLELSDTSSLTEREVEILTYVGQGLSNDEIANYLVISPHTVKTHVNRIMTKTGAHDRALLVILAYEAGLIVPGTH